MEYLYTPHFLILSVSTCIIGLCLAKLLNYSNLPYIWTHRVYKSSAKHGGELVAETLKAHGVKFSFVLPGKYLIPIMAAMEESGIRLVDTRQEATAVFAAESTSRLSGTVGVVLSGTGPCFTNTITALKSAQMAESPLLLISAIVPSYLKGLGAEYDMDQNKMCRNICKWTSTVTCVRDIVPVLSQAICTALSGTPGPVYVEFRADVLLKYERVSSDISEYVSCHSSGFKKWVNHWYVKYHLANIFAGAFETQDTTPLKPKIPIADANEVKKCVNLILGASRPMLILGSQTTLSPIPVEEVRKILEQLGTPCYLMGMARGILGVKNPILVRPHQTPILKESDLIFMCGNPSDFGAPCNNEIDEKAHLVFINRSKDQTENFDVNHKPSWTIEGDVGIFLKDLSKSLSGYEGPSNWIQKIQGMDQPEEGNEQMEDAASRSYLRPENVLSDLDQELPNNCILVLDGGDFVATAAKVLRPRGPLMWFDPGTFGTLGVGGGFALGVKMCRPESEVWVIYGDGACGYSLIEFDTYARHKLPVVALVGNNASWFEVAQSQVSIFGSSVACDLARADYHKTAEALGGEGILLKKGDDVVQKLRRARSLVATGRPILINAFIGRRTKRNGGNILTCSV